MLILPRCFILWVLVAIFSISSYAQLEKQKADSVLHTKGEVYLQISDIDRDLINILSANSSVDSYNLSKELANVYCNMEEFIFVNSLNRPYKVLPHPGERIKEPKMLHYENKAINQWDSYPTYPAYLSLMQDFQTTYPSLCSIIELDTTVLGRKMLFAKITSDVNSAKPRVLLEAAIHGDELVGYVLMLRLIDYLLSEYNTNTRIKNIVDNIELWINPLENPDGTYAGGNLTVYGSKRYNSNNVDLNRNFPNPVGGDHPNGSSWQRESIAIMNLLDSLSFTMSVDFHGGAEVFNYPWDSWVSSSNIHADDEWWKMIGKKYADTVFQNSVLPYFKGVSSTGITNGGDWYVVYGSQQDFANYYRSVKETTIEISNSKVPDPAYLPTYWNYNYRSILNYLSDAALGIRGIVTDSITQLPLKAKIFIENHDKDSSWVFSDSNSGQYFRPISSGNGWILTFSAEGYYSKSIECSISTGEIKIVDAELVPLWYQPPTPQFSAVETANTCNGTIRFINSTESDSLVTWLWDFGDGKTSTDQNPVHNYFSSGVYTVKLSATSSTGTGTMTKSDYIIIERPEAPVISDQAICSDSGSAQLISQLSYGEIRWFHNADEISAFFAGDTLNSGLLTSTTGYFVEQAYEAPSQYGGKYDNNGGGGYYSNDIDQFLVFNCHEACTLKTVSVYAETDGIREIILSDSSGQVLDSVSLFIAAGQQEIALNLIIPPQNSLRLTAKGACNLYRNYSTLQSFDYPYQIGNYISITSNSSESDGYYYFFYNWQVTGPECVSDRVPVFIFVNEQTEAMFSFSISNLSVLFENQTLYGIDYYWDFGDGGSSEEKNPEHLYSSTGTYTVSLIADNGCTADTIAKELILSGIEEYSLTRFSIYPNPVTEMLHIKLPEVNTSFEIFIYDGTGRNIISELTNPNTTELVLKIRNLSDGLYSLVIKNSGYILCTRKFIVAKN